MTPLAVDPSAYVIPYGAPAHLRPNTAPVDRTRAQAEDFESLFISSMMQHMFTGIGKEGPLGNSPSVGPWRSLLTDQYAKSMVKAGGVGLADQIYRSMMKRKGKNPDITSPAGTSPAAKSPDAKSPAAKRA